MNATSTEWLLEHAHRSEPQLQCLNPKYSSAPCQEVMQRMVNVHVHASYQYVVINGNTVTIWTCF